MKIQINTSAKNVEVANYLLGQAVGSLRLNPSKMRDMKLTPKDLDKAEAFRKSLIKGFVGDLNK